MNETNKNPVPELGGFKRDATALVDAAFMGLVNWGVCYPPKPTPVPAEENLPTKK